MVPSASWRDALGATPEALSGSSLEDLAPDPVQFEVTGIWPNAMTNGRGLDFGANGATSPAPEQASASESQDKWELLHRVIVPDTAYECSVLPDSK